MYTAERASRIRETFWLKLGKYLAPIPGAGGDKVNWINYKTGIKDFYFRMEATRSEARISVEIMQRDPVYSKKLYEQLVLLRGDFESTMQETWIWEPASVNDTNMPLSRLYTDLKNVNVLKEDDWPTIISFLKPRIILLDQFWNNNRMIFESLM